MSVEQVFLSGNNWLYYRMHASKIYLKEKIILFCFKLKLFLAYIKVLIKLNKYCA